jgi:hypothetical protein
MRYGRIATRIATLVAATSMVLAGEVYGKITDGSAPVPEGTEVSVKCGGKAYPAVKTDKAGSYHLVTAEGGKCTMTIQKGALSASVEFASYEDDAVQCDIVLETKDGKLTARRK